MNATRKIPRKRLWILSLLCLFAGIQFIQPAVSNPPVTHPMQAPEAVSRILKRACYDCHSNETKPTWFSKIAPASWLVSAQVNTARSRFNFSTWDTLSNTSRQTLLWEMVNMILDGKMPLQSYTAVHPEAKLSAADIRVLKQYVNSLNPVTYHDTALIRQSEQDFEQFRTKPEAPKTLPVAANGVQYISGYRNWQVISTTNRFDNNRSIRVVYANPIAAAAVKNNHIKPWPEGSVLVKVVWNIIEEENGDIIPGAFNNVQIMIKDNNRFPDSGGWGFAKFNGTGLKPYGNSPSFNAACFNCHKAASEYGYVFNIPLPDGDQVTAGQ